MFRDLTTGAAGLRVLSLVAMAAVAGATQCTPGQFQETADCYGSVTVHINLATHAEDISWNMDLGEFPTPGTVRFPTPTTRYTSEDNNRSFLHPFPLQKSFWHHKMYVFDSSDDGWHGGYWEVLNACNGSISGGPTAGQVSGAGGAFVMDDDTTRMECRRGVICCNCASTPGCDMAAMPSPIGDDIHTCSDCPSGRFSDVVGATECAGVCPPGTYSAPGSAYPNATSCTSCAPGQLDDDSDSATPCADCDAGRYSDEQGSVSSACAGVCPSGSYSAPGSASCADCGAGQLDDDSDSATPCANCDAGRYSGSDGVVAAECAGVCDVGTYAPPASNDTTSCESCGMGQSDVDSDAATPCLCPTGTYDLSLSDCVDGNYYPLSMEACAAHALSLGFDLGGGGYAFAGAYSVAGCYCYLTGGYAQKTFYGYSDSVELKRRPFAQGISKHRLPCTFTGCESCGPGQFDDDRDAATPCIACASGSFSNRTGEVGACTACPLGSTSAPGSLSLGACMATVEADWTVCEPCASLHTDWVNTTIATTVQQACGVPGSDARYMTETTPTLAEPGSGHILRDGEQVFYEASADYTNCVWTSGCPSGKGVFKFTSFLSEKGWDFLNLFSDVGLVTNAISNANNNGGIDNTGDLGRFTGDDQPNTILNVAAVQYLSDQSYTMPGANVAFTHTCGGLEQQCGLCPAGPPRPSGPLPLRETEMALITSDCAAAAACSG